MPWQLAHVVQAQREHHDEVVEVTVGLSDEDDIAAVRAEAGSSNNCDDTAECITIHQRTGMDL